jgi:hypothetical protein
MPSKRVPTGAIVHLQNGHKMVTKLWETPAKYANNCREMIEKARGGEIF